MWPFEWDTNQLADAATCRDKHKQFAWVVAVEVTLLDDFVTPDKVAKDDSDGYLHNLDNWTTQLYMLWMGRGSLVHL